MHALKSYDAFLTFSRISPESQAAIRQLIARKELVVDIEDDALEFRFQGRDAGDDIIATFSKIAMILHDASGEIRCEIDDDRSPDPVYRFYTIANSQLWVESGKIVRTERKFAVS